MERGCNTDRKHLLTRMTEMMTFQACKALVKDPAIDISILREAAKYLSAATRRAHRRGGHTTRGAEDCDEKECIAGIGAAAFYTLEADLRGLPSRPSPEVFPATDANDRDGQERVDDKQTG